MPFEFVFASHVLILQAGPDPSGDHTRREHSAVQRVTHALTAERVQLSCGVHNNRTRHLKSRPAHQKPIVRSCNAANRASVMHAPPCDNPVESRPGNPQSRTLEWNIHLYGSDPNPR